MYVSVNINTYILYMREKIITLVKRVKKNINKKCFSKKVTSVIRDNHKVIWW